MLIFGGIYNWKFFDEIGKMAVTLGLVNKIGKEKQYLVVERHVKMVFIEAILKIDMSSPKMGKVTFVGNISEKTLSLFLCFMFKLSW